MRSASPILAHRVAAHLDAMGVVHEPVEDAVGQRGIAYLFAPARRDSCEVRIVERTWSRSSQISQKSRRSSHSEMPWPNRRSPKLDAAKLGQQITETAISTPESSGSKR